MNRRIAQLPPAIANQIAAGEVIERPASVVKELLENSFDAGAAQINIDIGYGGLNQIKISDDGIGIIADDLPLAITAHATSKITNLDDLYAISSMGFRGEALASIASVARVSISSKPQQQEHAMMLTVQGSTYVLTPCARTVGTTIDVRDLFFNAPVRKRFLKNERLEFQAIEVVVKRFALSAPHIAINLTHNNKPVLSLPAAANAQSKQLRMGKIFGSTFIKNAIALDVAHGSMQLQGGISSTNYQRSQNDRQWVYINRRMVRDKLIHHAIKQAYAEILYPGRFPSCLLYFSLNTNEVDVNVHPTKHEVRFEQPRLVHDFFSTHLTKALRTDNACNESQVLTEVCEPLPRFAATSPSKDYVAYKLNRHRGTLAAVLTPSAEETIAWTVLNQQYCLFWLQQPYLVDVLQLYKAWLQQQIYEQIPLASRPLLVSISYSISDNLAQRINEVQQVLLSFGLVIEEHAREIVVRSVPMSIPYLDLKLFFQQLNDLDDYSLPQLANTVLHSQLFDAQQLSSEERSALSDYLLQLQNDTGQQLNFCKPFTAEDCRMLLHV